MLIKTFFKENSNKARAEVICDDAGQYSVEYYDLAGHKITTEQFPGKSIYYAEDAAENWAAGIKVLNG